MSKDYYDLLGVNKSSTADEIKKAYRKKAMEYHPDRNKGDSKAEEKFKNINEAYDTLGDSSKRKNYDMFGSSNGNFYNNSSSNSNYSSGGFGGFEDMFSNFSGGGRATSGGSSHFDFSDIFGGGASSQGGRQTDSYEEKLNLDIEKTAEIPFFDFLFGTSVQVNNGIGKSVTIKVKEGTKPGIKMRVKGYGRASGKKVGNLIVKIDAKMPKEISDIDKNLLSTIRDNIGY